MITTHPVFVPTDGANAVMEIVRWLRTKRLTQGVDFDFKYQHTDWNMQDFSIIRRGATFFFKDEKWATFMKIKYGDDIQRDGSQL